MQNNKNGGLTATNTLKKYIILYGALNVAIYVHLHRAYSQKSQIKSQIFLIGNSLDKNVKYSLF